MRTANQPEKSREKWIDAAKGIAMLAVVIGHIAIAPFTHIGLAFELPLFALLSGLTFHSESNFSNFTRKKGIRLLLPYVLGALIGLFVLPLFWIGRPLLYSEPITVKYLATGFFFGTNLVTNAPLWFLPAFFFAFVIAFLLLTHMKKFIGASIPFLIFISLAIHRFLFKQTTTLLIPFSIDLAFTLAAFLEIGYILKLGVRKLNTFFAFVLLSFVFCIGYILNGPVDFFGRQFGNSVFLFFLNSLTGSFAVVSLSQILESYTATKSILTSFSYLGRRSLALLLYHWPMLLLLNWIFLQVRLLDFIHARPSLVTLAFDGKAALPLRLFLFAIYLGWAVAGSLVMDTLVSRVASQMRPYFSKVS